MRARAAACSWPAPGDAWSPSTAPRPAQTVAWHSALDDAARDAVAAGDIPGAVIVVGQGDRCSTARPSARAPRCRPPEPMTTDTIFDVASLTKVVATAPAVLALVDDGKVDLDAPLGRYLKEFGGPRFREVTVRRGADPQRRASPICPRPTRFPGASRRPRGSWPGPVSPSPRAPLPLQRHRLHPARRAGAAGERRAARPVHAEALLRARSACRTPPSARPPSGEAASRPPRWSGPCSAAWSTTATRGCCAAWRGTRGSSRPRMTSAASAGCCSAGGELGGRRYSQEPPSAPCSSRTRSAKPRAGSAGTSSSAYSRAAGLVLPDGLGGAYRLHRHVHLDGSGDPGVRHPPHQPRPSLWQGQCGRAAPAGERGGGRRVLRVHGTPPVGTAARPDRGDRPAADAAPPCPSGPTRTGLDSSGAGLGPAGRALVGLVTNQTGVDAAGAAQNRPAGRGAGA